MNSCTTDIKTWMSQNQLKLNDDKTEALLFTPPNLNTSTPIPSGVQVGPHLIPFCVSAKNLGFILDSELSMKEHIKSVCQLANYELSRIGSIRRYLNQEAAKTLVTS